MTNLDTWDDRRVARLKALNEQGVSIRGIAEAFGDISVGTVGRKLRALGLNKPTSLEVAETFWTPENVERLRQLHADGLTYGRIGTLLGCSRNAVCAKCDRLRLKRPKADKVTRLPSAPSAPKPRGKMVIAGGYTYLANDHCAPLPTGNGELEPLVRSLEALGRHHCKWPIGNADFAFCGRPRADGGNYCAHHAARAFAPSQKKSDNALAKTARWLTRFE